MHLSLKLILVVAGYGGRYTAFWALGHPVCTYSSHQKSYMLATLTRALSPASRPVAPIPSHYGPGLTIVYCGTLIRTGGCGCAGPAAVAATCALTFAWVIAMPWSLPWYTSVAWVALALLPRNTLTRWLTLTTGTLAILHFNGGHAMNTPTGPTP